MNKINKYWMSDDGQLFASEGDLQDHIDKLNSIQCIYSRYIKGVKGCGQIFCKYILNSEDIDNLPVYEGGDKFHNPTLCGGSEAYCTDTGEKYYYAIATRSWVQYEGEGGSKRPTLKFSVTPTTINEGEKVTITFTATKGTSEKAPDLEQGDTKSFIYYSGEKSTKILPAGDGNSLQYTGELMLADDTEFTAQITAGSYIITKTIKVVVKGNYEVFFGNGTQGVTPSAEQITSSQKFKVDTVDGFSIANAGKQTYNSCYIAYPSNLGRLSHIYTMESLVLDDIDDWNFTAMKLTLDTGAVSEYNVYTKMNSAEYTGGLRFLL